MPIEKFYLRIVHSGFVYLCHIHVYQTLNENESWSIIPTGIFPLDRLSLLNSLAFYPLKVIKSQFVNKLMLQFQWKHYTKESYNFTPVAAWKKKYVQRCALELYSTLLRELLSLWFSLYQWKIIILNIWKNNCDIHSRFINITWRHSIIGINWFRLYWLNIFR